ncbi:MAG TPA: hypothetical protein VGL35_11995 [Rhizomicrobium sp.]|jgi:hypothetical protein
MRDPTISIAGRTWRVPLLAPRQNRIVLPALMKPAADIACLLDMVFAAMTRACPHLDRDEFEDLPIPFHELLDAIPVIAQQTGFLVSAKAETRTNGPPDFDALIAEFCNYLPGTTPDYWEDALTAPRLAAMREQWRRHPPLAVLAAAWLRYRPRPRDEDALAELLRLFPNGQLRLN